MAKRLYSPRKRSKPPMTEAQRAEAADLAQRGHSIRAIAEKVGTSTGHVAKLRRELGLVVSGRKGFPARSLELIRPYAGSGKTPIEIGRELGVPADWVRKAGRELGIEFPPSLQTRGRLPDGSTPSKIALDELVRLVTRHPTAGFRDLEAMTGLAHQSIASRLKRRRPDLYERVRKRCGAGHPGGGVDMRRLPGPPGHYLPAGEIPAAAE